MNEWKKYEGSDEQIAEIIGAENGWIHRTRDGTESSILRNSPSIVEYAGNEVTHYLICEPHPLAAMIIRQAQTGQPVWIRQDMYQPVYGHYLESWSDGKNFIFKTVKPDWNISGAEYSFTPFED